MAVFLVTDSNSGGSFGTAFVIYQDESAAYFLTCSHVVQSIETENIRVGGRKATVVVAGEDGQDPDLAILRVEELKDQPCWTLRTLHKEGIPFVTEGFCKDGKDFHQRKLRGKLGDQIPIHLYGGNKSFYGWDLKIENGKKLRPGNSGSPVWDQRSQCVFGVVSRRQVDGHEGLAISVDIPSGLIKNPPINIHPVSLAASAFGVICLVGILIYITQPKNPCPEVLLEPTSEFKQPASSFSGEIRIAGSTSMDNLNQSLKTEFESRYPGARVIFTSSGSGDGKEKLQNDRVDIAAVSENISNEEFQQNSWKAFTIAPAPIAVVISPSNPYPKDQGLTSQQVKEVYAGSTTQWSQLQAGRIDPIRIINRNVKSGTRAEFQSLALEGQSFGSAPVVEEWYKDETYAVLQELKTNGIYYATCHQAATQLSAARILAIDGKLPNNNEYPYKRPFLYVYRVGSTGQPSDQVSAFLGFVNSEEGRRIVQDALSGKTR